MGCSLSPIIAEALVQHIFKTASSNFPNPPRVLKFFVDDSFLILKRSSLESFFDYINNFNKELKSIKFTKEEENPEGVLPFLDLHIKRVNNTLQTRVYRKATHSNRYLNFESYHSLENKKSVIRTLINRAFTHVSNEDILKIELNNTMNILENNNYPTKVIKDITDRVKKKFINSDDESK